MRWLVVVALVACSHPQPEPQPEPKPFVGCDPTNPCEDGMLCGVQSAGCPGVEMTCTCHRGSTCTQGTCGVAATTNETECDGPVCDQLCAVDNGIACYRAVVRDLKAAIRAHDAKAACGNQNAWPAFVDAATFDRRANEAFALIRENCLGHAATACLIADLKKPAPAIDFIRAGVLAAACAP
jgi:hypothetical protein